MTGIEIRQVLLADMERKKATIERAIAFVNEASDETLELLRIMEPTMPTASLPQRQGRAEQNPAPPPNDTEDD
jgi:hypothetical protein